MIDNTKEMNDDNEKQFAQNSTRNATTPPAELQDNMQKWNQNAA